MASVTSPAICTPVVLPPICCCCWLSVSIVRLPSKTTFPPLADDAVPETVEASIIVVMAGTLPVPAVVAPGGVIGATALAARLELPPVTTERRD